MDLEQFQEDINIYFDDVQLLIQALTHRSYVNEHIGEPIADNERLEYLGDAVLDFLTASMLYKKFPNMPEGEMTRLRAALVRTESLAKLAKDCNIDRIMLIGKGEATSGGRNRIANLCGAFEAFVGATYIDHGLETVETFITPRLDKLLEDVMNEAISKDARSQFQEWAQANHNITPHYKVIGASGPEHSKEFTVQMFLNTIAITTGKGKTKRAAAQSAARNALRKLENNALDLGKIILNTQGTETKHNKPNHKKRKPKKRWFRQRKKHPKRNA